MSIKTLTTHPIIWIGISSMQLGFYWHLLSIFFSFPLYFESSWLQTVKIFLPFPFVNIFIRNTSTIISFAHPIGPSSIEFFKQYNTVIHWFFIIKLISCIHQACFNVSTYQRTYSINRKVFVALSSYSLSRWSCIASFERQPGNQSTFLFPPKSEKALLIVCMLPRIWSPFGYSEAR